MDYENLDKRISSLELWRGTIDVALTKHDINSDYMKKEFSELKEELKEIKRAAKNLNLTFWGALILVLIKFLLSGGLANFI